MAADSRESGSRTAVLTGRCIVPGRACGPLSEEAGGIAVLPDLPARRIPSLADAAGLVTRDPGPASHAATMCRGLGLPTLGVRGSPLLPAEPGDILLLDASEGRLEVPGGADRCRRRTIRELFEALAGLRAGADARVVVDRVRGADAWTARFVLEAGWVFHRLVPGAASRAVLDALPEELPAAWREKAGRRIETRCAALVAERAAGAAASGSVPHLDALRDELAASIAAARSRVVDLGGAADFLDDLASRVEADLSEQRAALIRELDARAERALTLDDTETAARVRALERLAESRGRTGGRAWRLLAGRVGRAKQELGRRLGERRTVEIPGDGPLPPALVGGKAARLSELGGGLPDGWRVPPGFAVTTVAFAHHVAGGIESRLRALCTEVADVDELSRRARAAIRSEPLCLTASADLARAVVRLGAPALAVRSSSPFEGGAAGTFAGLLDSFLAVPADEVARRVMDVWCSQWDAAVLEALRRRDMDPLKASPAALVQPSIDARATGIAERTGTGDVRIRAVRGLGEPLTAGELAGDSYRVRGRRVEVVAEVPPFRVDPAVGGGTVEVALGPGERGSPGLDDAEALSVAELTRALDPGADGAVAVEFCVDRGGCRWVLQVRC